MPAKLPTRLTGAKIPRHLPLDNSSCSLRRWRQVGPGPAPSGLPSPSLLQSALSNHPPAFNPQTSPEQDRDMGTEALFKTGRLGIRSGLDFPGGCMLFTPAWMYGVQSTRLPSATVQLLLSPSRIRKYQRKMRCQPIRNASECLISHLKRFGKAWSQVA